MQAVFWVLVAGLVLLALVWCFVPHGLRLVAERQLAARARSARAIVLSYDDGPDPDLTPQLTKLLAEEDARATFFVIGEKAKANPELVAELLERGHDVGSHTYEHLNAWKVSPGRHAQDRAKGAQIVDDLGGQGEFFRPPFGKMTLFGLLRGGQTQGWWTVDSRDTFAPRAENDILREIEAAGGGVVLMHDRAKPPRLAPEHGPHPDYVLTLTKNLLSFAKDNNYQVLPLSDLLPKGRAA